jgi:hypothetical protein
MSTGGEVRTETASEKEKTSRPSEKRISYTTAPHETGRNSQIEQTSFLFCQAVRNEG